MQSLGSNASAEEPRPLSRPTQPSLLRLRAAGVGQTRRRALGLELPHKEEREQRNHAQVHREVSRGLDEVRGALAAVDGAGEAAGEDDGADAAAWGGGRVRKR